MPDDPAQLIDIPLGLFAACLHIYHEQGHMISNKESDLFNDFINHYVSRHKVRMDTLKAVKAIVVRIWNES